MCGEGEKGAGKERVIVLQSEQDKLIRKTAVEDIHHFVVSLFLSPTKTEEEKV